MTGMKIGYLEALMYVVISVYCGSQPASWTFVFLSIAFPFVLQRAPMWRSPWWVDPTHLHQTQPPLATLLSCPAPTHCPLQPPSPTAALSSLLLSLLMWVACFPCPSPTNPGDDRGVRSLTSPANLQFVHFSNIEKNKIHLLYICGMVGTWMKGERVRVGRQTWEDEERKRLFSQSHSSVEWWDSEVMNGEIM